MLKLTLLLLLLQLATVGALDNGLALTPPMGWLAWERFVCELDCAKNPNQCIDHNLFEQQAQRMVEDGYKQVGYEYVNIDDCWSKRQREPQTNLLLPDPQRFPSMRQLADKIHALGLKLGIYGDCGTHTCQLFPGQLMDKANQVGNYFALDAQSFADWTIDSFKFDGCYLEVSRAGAICPLMGEALNKTNRPMLFSCSWPAYELDEKLATNWTQVVERCNLWRAFGDIEDSWSSVLATIDYFVQQQELVLEFHGPGHWFDADQLVIGNFGLSLEQERAQMAVWCIWASPLYMSNDLRAIQASSAAILKNRWAIGVNQDPMGIFGLMVEQVGQVQVFVKPVEPLDADGCPSYAVVYLDRRTLGNGRLASFKLANLLAKTHAKLERLAQWRKWAHCATRGQVSFSVRDLFDDNSLLIDSISLATGQLALRTDPSGARLVKLSKNAP